MLSRAEATERMAMSSPLAPSLGRYEEGSGEILTLLGFDPALLVLDLKISKCSNGAVDFLMLEVLLVVGNNVRKGILVEPLGFVLSISVDTELFFISIEAGLDAVIRICISFERALRMST